jgi:septation ring formation regulator EzrA
MGYPTDNCTVQKAFTKALARFRHSFSYKSSLRNLFR